MVIGTAPYEFIANFYRKPMVVAGFEPLDILQSIWMVLKQIKEGRAEIENQYARVVPDGGNAPALTRSRASTSCASSSNGAASARSIIPA
jgi:hydrogenase expression/formation protein HypD